MSHVQIDVYMQKIMSVKCCYQKGRGKTVGNFILLQPCWLCFGSGIAVCGVFSTSQISPVHL